MTAIHATAIIDPGAELDESVSIGAYTLIGPHVRVGAEPALGHIV
jgi:UDP-N-acetylglucosamine acyltransferase